MTSMTTSQRRFREWLGVIRQQAFLGMDIDPDLCGDISSPGHKRAEVSALINLISAGLSAMDINEIKLSIWTHCHQSFSL